MKQNKKIAIFSLMIAIEIILAIVPVLGFIPIGIINITTLQIPVVLTSLLLNEKYGAAIGLLFGIISVIQNTINPNATSFVFSPFIEISSVHGNISSLITAIIPRVLCGIVPALVTKKIKNKHNIKLAAIAGSMTNTVLVLTCIYFLFGHAYASAKGIAFNTLITTLLIIVGSNGIAEAILCTVLCSAICKRANIGGK